MSIVREILAETSPAADAVLWSERSGFVGTTLAHKLLEQGHQVTILTRKMGADHTLPRGASFLEGDPTKRGEWQKGEAVGIPGLIEM